MLVKHNHFTYMVLILLQITPVAGHLQFNIATIYEHQAATQETIIATQEQVELALQGCQQCRTKRIKCEWGPDGMSSTTKCMGCLRDSESMCSNAKVIWRTCDQDPVQAKAWPLLDGYKGFGLYHFSKCLAKMLKKHSLTNGLDRSSLGTSASVAYSLSTFGALIGSRLPKNLCSRNGMYNQMKRVSA